MHALSRTWRTLSCLVPLLVVTASIFIGCGGGGGGGGATTGDLVVGSNPPAAFLDATFAGGEGFLSLDDFFGSAQSTIEDASGRYVVVGAVVVAGNQDAAVWRLNDDGTLDTTFGIDGIVIDAGAAGGLGFDGASDAAIDASSRIVVVGTSASPNGDLDVVVWRFLDDGTLDATFGVGGVAVAGNLLRDEQAFTVEIDTQGRIVVGGVSQVPADSDPGQGALWRFLDDGTLDLDFADNGAFLTGDAEDVVSDILIDLVDQVLVVGSRGDALAIWLLDDIGELVEGFADQGLATYFDVDASLEGFSAAVYNDETFVVVGRRSPDVGEDEMAVFRFLGDGQVDFSFNGQGFLTYATTLGDSMARSVSVAITGQLVIAGTTTVIEEDESLSEVGALWLVSAFGLFDPALGVNGVVHLADLSTEDGGAASSVLIDSQNRVLVSGFVVPDGLQAIASLWRFP